MDHKYLNSVIEEYITELNSPNILNKKGKQPGNLYHAPVILRGFSKNSFTDIDSNVDLNDPSNFLLPASGSIKDAQVQGQRRISRTFLGYMMINRAEKNKTLKEDIKFIIENAVMDLKEKLLKTYNEVPYIGEIFLTLLKDENGNYFRDLESHAGYELRFYSCCAVNPPNHIDVNTFDKDVAKNWNIRFP